MPDAQLVSAYKRRIEKEVAGYQDDSARAETSYSREYQLFKQEQAGAGHLLFERLCNRAAKIMPVQIAEKDYYKIYGDVKLAHLEITPQGVYSLAYLSAIGAVILSVVLALLLKSFLLVVVGPIGALIAIFYLPTVPKQILTTWRAQASDQLVLAVLYIVIYMQHTPNLERAIKFVAEHVSPPLSLDFAKILWDVETKKYSNIDDAIEDYITTWRGWDDEFIESMHLIKASLYEPDSGRKRDLLDNSIKVILDGTQNHMLTYAHQLQSPMESLHMLGVVLPVMGLVMFPMIGAFMGASIKWYYIALMYNVGLPIIVYVIGKSVLSTRPAGSDTSDVYEYIQQKYKRPAVTMLGAQIQVPPWLVGGLVWFLSGIPSFIYFAYMFALSGEALTAEFYSLRALLLSLDFILSIALGLGAYYWWQVHYLVQVKKDIEKMESEFAAAVFQLGEKLEQHEPPEVAIVRLGETMAASESAKLFKTIAYNMTNLGANLKDAIFNKQYGAAVFYPSAIIKSALSLFVEGARKGPEIAGRSLLTISEYLTSVQKVTARLQDLLAETVSSMTSQVRMFIPLITGIVVGLASLTTTIMTSLGGQIKTFSTNIPGSSPESGGTLGTGLLSIFQIESMVPQFIFQIIVGIYVIEIIYILTFLLTGIIYGHDEIEQRDALAKNFILSAVAYVLVAGIGAVMLGMLVGPITQLRFQ
jgi:hypothetical protein